MGAWRSLLSLIIMNAREDIFCQGLAMKRPGKLTWGCSECQHGVSISRECRQSEWLSNVTKYNVTECLHLMTWKLGKSFDNDQQINKHIHALASFRLAGYQISPYAAHNIANRQLSSPRVCLWPFVLSLES